MNATSTAMSHERTILCWSRLHELCGDFPPSLSGCLCWCHDPRLAERSAAYDLSPAALGPASVRLALALRERNR